MVVYLVLFVLFWDSLRYTFLLLNYVDQRHLSVCTFYGGSHRGPRGSGYDVVVTRSSREGRPVTPFLPPSSPSR